ncbi:MAG: M23 family metallopeptidase [Candidatus Woesearchaeota archaeon]|nr:MAG: M23 family metallopeptidase [Candidatus Woesearchaeota archaeon]
MKTKNKYQYPIDKKNIQIILTRESPAHKISRKGEISWDLRNSIDFLCKEGTPIRAAQNGIIAKIRDTQKETYNGSKEPSEEILPQEKQDGNYIVIRHHNDEFSFYGHLKYKGIVVKKEQKVKAGEVIGYSGHTGWSIKPHLHFMVFKFLGKILDEHEGLESLEINWKQS